MTQKTITNYKQEFLEKQKQQRRNVEQYNRKRTKDSKRNVMNNLIIPLEEEIYNLQKGIY